MKCKQCGGKPKNSHAILTYIQTDRLGCDRMIVTKRVQCQKCVECGHSWIN